MYDVKQFADKYRLAVETATQNKPEGGLCGVELEWNLLDSNLRPLLTVGSGPGEISFVDFLRTYALPSWVKAQSQLEVFHWMIEWATQPYYSPRGAIYESRLLEGTLINALQRAGERFGDQLYYWHGNLLYNTEVDHRSIPGSWNLAKRRYLERCVDMYGNTLATAGTHTNLSLPEPLLAWDFMHLPESERGNSHFDNYKSEFYITATRLMRAYTALFIATSASTPLQARLVNGEPVVLLTEIDSVRNLTFPNPESIDIPNLYRSYADYLELSYDLVRHGIRFGNNNWTPVRARSFAEPVERLIDVTSEQLQDLYTRGLYALGEMGTKEEMAAKIEIQNLLARINLPMSRVEIRTDDGGHSLDVEVANMTLKHLLLASFYADKQFGRAFRYDREDLNRARRNEEKAAQNGLRAEIENPFTAKVIPMRDFLKWTLAEVEPLAVALDVWEDLEPLRAMAQGEHNTAERLREWLSARTKGQEIIPIELLRELAESRQSRAVKDIEHIAENYPALGEEAQKIGEILQRSREDVHSDLDLPVRFRPRQEGIVNIQYKDKTDEILAMAKGLIRIPSVTATPRERLEEVRRAATFIYDYARNRGLGARYYKREKYPALLIGFPGQMQAKVMLSGHFDVVPPEPDDSQFEPRVEGDYLIGRGSADMKTVVATFLVWMKDQVNSGPPYPPINLLLVGNEENGEMEAMGTPHMLKLLSDETGYQPSLMIAGERTGEKGDEPWGKICIQNRGIMRFNITAQGQRGHSGIAGVQMEMTQRLFSVKSELTAILSQHLSLDSPDGWQSQIRFPFVQAGTPGIYNVTADYGVIGVEVRPIPQDDLNALHADLERFCASQDLKFLVSVMENGIACNPENHYLSMLMDAVGLASGLKVTVGRKLPATSARFAPDGQGVVWGQSGIGPHSKNERHYIPSIEPYYRALGAYADLLIKEIDT